MQIPVFRGNVEVPHHAEGLTLLQLGGHIAAETVQPGQLVAVAPAADGCPVGNVNIEDAQGTQATTDHTFLLAEGNGLPVLLQQPVKADA